MLQPLVLALILAAAGNPGATKAKGTTVAAKKRAPQGKGAPAAPPPSGEAAVPATLTAIEVATPVAAVPSAPTAEAPKAGALRVAVLDPTKLGEIPERPLAAFSQALVPEIRKLEGVSAIGMGEVRDMLAFDRQRQLLGCSDESCLAEIGGALGVDEIISSQLTLVGKSYSLTLKRVSLKKAKVIQAETKHFDKRDGEELLAVVGPMIGSLFPGKELKPGKTRGVDKEAARKLNPPPLPRWVFLATGGAAIAAAAGGGVFGLLMKDSVSSYNRLAERSVKEEVAGSDLKSYESTANSRAKTANILFIAGAGLAVAAGVEAFFTDWHNDRASLSIQPVALSDGGGVTLAGVF
jgi:hypothetical protein